jgi:hypothetical protein
MPKHPNSAGGGGIVGGGAHLTARTRAYDIKVDQRSVYPDQPKRMDTRLLICVRCDHHFKSRALMLEDGHGNLVCAGRVSCWKRQNGREG